MNWSRRMLILLVFVLSGLALTSLIAYSQGALPPTPSTDAGSGELAYVTLSNSNWVALVDLQTHLVPGYVNVGGAGCSFPWRATRSPDGGFVYVGCYNSGSVAVIETAGNTVVANIPGIPYADDVAFTRDGAYALVGSRWSSQIAVVDTAALTVTAYITTPAHARSLAAHPTQDVIYATSGDGTLLVIDTTSFTIQDSIQVGGEPWDVAVSFDGQWVFTGDRWGSGLRVVDSGTNTVYTTVTGLGDLTGLDVAPDGSAVYASGLWNGVNVIDGVTFGVVTTIGGIGTAWEVAVTCDGSELFVGNVSSFVPVIDTGTLSLEEQIAMPGSGTRGIAACRQGGEKAVLLLPEAQTNSATPGETVVHTARLVNLTGVTDSFDLALGAYSWDTALSATSVGPLAFGDAITFTVSVTIPAGADWYDSDTVQVTATSVTSPTVYTDTAQFTTLAYAPPQISVAPGTFSTSPLVGEVVTRTLTISNGNGVTLTFETGEGGATFIPGLRARSNSREVTPGTPSKSDRSPGGAPSSLLPAGTASRGSGTPILQGNSVLIIQENDPWGYTSIQQILEANAIGYDQINSSLIPSINLTAYKLVIIPSSQCCGFYTVWDANIAKFEAYLQWGGALWLSSTTQGETPLIPGGVNNIFYLEDYNVIAEPSHPWVAGVPNPMYGNYASYNYFTNLSPNSVSVAYGQGSGNPTLVDYQLGSGRIMLTGQTLEYAWQFGWDSAPILENSLLDMYFWTSDVPWLSTDPISGTVPTNGSLPVEVTFDATGQQPGTYTASLLVFSNDPDEPLVTVPVTMSVSPTADMGRVVGSVSDAWTGLPLTATVELEGVHTAIARPDFSIWASAGTYNLTASADGYYTGTWQVEILAGAVTTLNPALEPAQPRIEWPTGGVSGTAVTGYTATQTLVISDTGPLPLDVALFEISPTLRLAAPSNLPGKRILYDLYHGEPATTNYSQLVNDLVAAGAEVDGNLVPITPAVLAGYDILWVNCCGYMGWTFSELTAVADWLDDGGAVLVQGDDSPATADLIDVYAISYQSGFCTYGETTSDIELHPISNGVDSLYIEYTCTYLSAGPEAEVVVHDPRGQVHVVANQSGAGKMVVIAGQDFTDGVIANADNRLFAGNVFAWLAEPGYGDLPWLSVVPITATVPAHSSVAIQVNFDATALAVGTYQAILAVEHNDPAQVSPVQIPVSLTVIPYVPPEWTLNLPVIFR